MAITTTAKSVNSRCLTSNLPILHAIHAMIVLSDDDKGAVIKYPVYYPGYQSQKDNKNKKKNFFSFIFGSGTQGTGIWGWMIFQKSEKKLNGPSAHPRFLLNSSYGPIAITRIFFITS